MEFLDGVHTGMYQSLNEKKRISKKNRIEVKGENPNLVQENIDQFMTNLNTNDLKKVAFAMWDLAICFKIDPSTSSLIEQQHIINILQMMKSNDIKFISLAFNFINKFIQCQPSKVSFFIENNLLELAVSKIPMKSACDFIIELLKFSDNLKDDDLLNVYPFFFKYNLRHVLLDLFSTLKTYEHQQCQILMVLSFLWKNQDFSQDEFDKFIRASRIFLVRAENDCFIIYLNFLMKINSPLFYSSFGNIDFDLFCRIWEKIKEKDDEVCLACFDFINSVISNNYNYINLISNDVLHNISIFLRVKNKDNTKVQGAKIIEKLLSSNQDFATHLLNSEYVAVMKNFLSDGNFFDQYLAMRFVSVLMIYNRCNQILDLLKYLNPIQRIIEFLNGTDYSLICNLLNCIRNDWEVCINMKSSNEFLVDIIKLMDNQDFIFALQYIETDENGDASHLARQLINFIEDHKKIKLSNIL